MEVLVFLGVTWLALALGVVGLCVAAQRGDRQVTAMAPDRRDGGGRRRRPVRRAARLRSSCGAPAAGVAVRRTSSS